MMPKKKKKRPKGREERRSNSNISESIKELDKISEVNNS